MKRKTALPILCFLVLVFLSTACLNAQSVNTDDIKAQMVKDWERAKSYTIDYLNSMPADKYSFKAQDSIRNFAQQMLHLASGNAFLMSNASDQAPPGWLSFTLEQRVSAQQKDSVMYFISSSYDYCINSVKSSDANKWGEKKKLFGRFEETKFTIMNKTFEHQTHHRGQTTIYIRLAGVKPPEERLF